MVVIAIIDGAISTLPSTITPELAPVRNIVSITRSKTPSGRALNSRLTQSSSAASFRRTVLRFSHRRFSHETKSISAIRAGGLVEKVSADKLNEYLMEERTVPIVIDFYATWCGPCVILAQELERLAVEYQGQVKFLKVDTDEEFQLASQLEIRGLPTMVFVSPSEEKKSSRTEGLLPANTIREIIDDLRIKTES